MKVDSVSVGIEPILIDRGGRHIGVIIAAELGKVHRQKAEDSVFLSVRANTLGSIH